MACLPGLAQADNEGIQYETEVPTVPNNESSNIPSANSGGTNTPDGSGPGASTSDTPGGAGSGGSDDPGTGGGAHQGQTNQASGGDDAKAADGSKPAAGQVGEAQRISVAPVADTSSAEEGSSPLVPILIAIAVLAAISIGAFYYRQRRQGPGSPVSPKAS
jgi:hypothetical protein